MFAATVFLSSLLLFLIQPMLAKTLLPWFGGAAGVWVTSMLFFQVALLLGYCYAHWTTVRLSPTVQAVVHGVLLAVSLTLLPLEPAAPSREATVSLPELRILGLLAVSVGLPCLLLGATGPLVQVWHSRRFARGFPYRLYSVSNAACLAALLAYPFVIEPSATLRVQTISWSACYVAFAVLAAWLALRSGGESLALPAAGPVSWKDRLLWIGLAAGPSALWLGVADHVSLNLAAVPLLWVLPLSLYLLSFIVCFHREGWYRPRLMRWLMPLAVVCLVVGIKQDSLGIDFLWAILLLLAGLFLICVFCHGELALRRPEPLGLTSFYLMVALGGVLGAAFVSLLAPLLFNDYFELPISIAACVVLAIALLYGYASPRRMFRIGIGAVAGFVLALSFQSGDAIRMRNFYGVLELREAGQGEYAYRSLYNGKILHGVQFLSPDLSREATTYYSPESGVGKAFEAVPDGNRRIGVVGLGVGTLATYARQGDSVRFYEINPLVVQLAREKFRYLAECHGSVELVLGDARLALEREAPQGFDVLAIDAFTGDAVPVHLLTREAFALYTRHLKPGGVLAVHVSSKYLDLAPAVVRVGESLGWNSEVVENSRDDSRRVMASTWGVFHGRRPPVPGKVWTDQFSNLLEVLK